MRRNVQWALGAVGFSRTVGAIDQQSILFENGSNRRIELRVCGRSS